MWCVAHERDGAAPCDSSIDLVQVKSAAKQELAHMPSYRRSPWYFASMAVRKLFPQFPQ